MIIIMIILMQHKSPKTQKYPNRFEKTPFYNLCYAEIFTVAAKIKASEVVARVWSHVTGVNNDLLNQFGTSGLP